MVNFGLLELLTRIAMTVKALRFAYVLIFAWCVASMAEARSDVRTAETATVLAERGFTNIKVHSSSWPGYGNSLEVPANNTVFLNVGAMQSRIEAPEMGLAAARAQKPAP